MCVKSVSLVIVCESSHCFCVPLVLSDRVTMVHLPQSSCVVTGRCMRREGGREGGKEYGGRKRGREGGRREGIGKERRKRYRGRVRERVEKQKRRII